MRIKPAQNAVDLSALSNTQRLVRELWKNLLGTKKIGPSTNFFEMGEHSLLMVKFVSRVRDAFGFELSILSVFEAQTLVDISTIIDDVRSKTAPSDHKASRETFRI